MRSVALVEERASLLTQATSRLLRNLATVVLVGDPTSPTWMRALVMSEPLSSDANEITDKGYINQRAVLERRAALIEKLHADSPAPEVIVTTE